MTSSAAIPLPIFRPHQHSGHASKSPARSFIHYRVIRGSPLSAFGGHRHHCELLATSDVADIIGLHYLKINSIAGVSGSSG